MNIGRIKNMALKLMDEFTLSGLEESGQQTADYTLKMNTLIDLAQNEISDHCGIYAVSIVDTATDTPAKVANGFNFYDLPVDLKDFRYVVMDNQPYPFAADDYEVINNQFKISSGYTTAIFEIHYYKFPTAILDDTPDTTELEVDLETQYAIPYYVAGMCGASASEDTQLSDKLLNIWAIKLSGMTKREIRAPKRTRDVVRW